MPEEALHVSGLLEDYFTRQDISSDEARGIRGMHLL